MVVETKIRHSEVLQGGVCQSVAYLPSYPAGDCMRCRQDAWGVKPDLSGYYCTNCITEEKLIERYGI